jgi:hypothetical protein
LVVRRGAGLSEGLSIRLAAVEQLEAAEDAKREQERKRRAEAFQERAFQAAIAQAIADGENMNPRLAMQGRGIGHQPHEFVAMISERMDLEDQRLEAVQHREFLRWQAEQSASTSGDTTAPSSLELEEGAAIQARTDFYLDRKRQRSMAVEEARRLAARDAARGDRGVLTRVARAAAQAFGEAGGQTEYRMGDDPTGFGFVIR